MPIRLTGMNSGLDTDSIVQALMSAYRVKGDKYKKEQTKVSWKQDKWKALNTKVYNLYKSLDNLRFTSGYNLKKVTISDTSKATVSGASNAMNGSQTLKINQLAQASYLTGDKIAAANGNTKLSELMSEAADGSSYEGGTIHISGNGKAKDIEVTGSTTVNDFIKELNNSGTGITASYDNTNKRIYISSKKTGAAAGFELSVSDNAGSKALAALGLSSGMSMSKAEGDAWKEYYGDGTDAAIESNLKKAINDIIDAKGQLEENKSLRDEELLDQKFNKDTVKYLEARKSLEKAKYDVGGDEEDASAMAQLLKMSEKNRAKEYVMGDNGKLRVKKTDGTDDNKAAYTLETKKYKQNAAGTRTYITADDPVGEGEKTGVEYTLKKLTPSDPPAPSDSFVTLKTLHVLDEYDEDTATDEEEAFDNLKKYAANETAVKNYEKAADSDIEAGNYGKRNVIEQTDAALMGLTDYDAVKTKLDPALTDYDGRLKQNQNNLKNYNDAIDTINKDLAKPKYAILEVNKIDIDIEPSKKDEYVTQLAQKFAAKVKYYHAELSQDNVKMVDKDGNTVSLSDDGKKDKDGNLVGNDGYVYDKNKYDFDGEGNVVDKTTGKQVDEKNALYQIFYTKAGENSGAKMVQGTDAEIELNGVSYTSSKNSFNINGLSIQAQAKTNGDDVTVTTATDTQGIYDKVKDFISEYNSLISEISSLYNAESAKGYEPLTSEEKEAMSDKEVEEWEAKVKGALLRRDDSLSSLMNSMTSSMLSSVKIGNKSYSLASLGIKTAGYFHMTAAARNELHIDGDEDDDTTSSKTNTLMNMLNSDPDKAIEIIKGVADNLYKSINKKMMTTNGLKSINSIYNDKEMSQSYSDYTKTISAWEEKIQKIEDDYYKKFSAMEVALSKLQSQQSSLAGLLGQ